MPSYNYNSSNELTSNSNGSYAYDANGNTLSDAQGRGFTWDFENRLTQVVNPGVGTTTFRYDPFGRRIQKSGPLGTTNYLYDGLNLLEEIDNSGNIAGRYTHSVLIDEVLSESRSGTTSYYQQDALGSVVSLSNPAAALTNTYSYDSFGNLAASTGTLANPFQYTGREFDTETRLYFLRARYYNADAGRFISQDPINFGGGINFYSYVRNSPIGLVDISGLAAGGAPAWVSNLAGLFPGSELQNDSGQGPFEPYSLLIHLPCKEVERILRDNGYADSSWGWSGPGSSYWDPIYMSGGSEWRTHGPGHHFRMPYDPGNYDYSQNARDHAGPWPQDCSSDWCKLDHFHTDAHNPIDWHHTQHIVCDLAHINWGWLCN